MYDLYKLLLYYLENNDIKQTVNFQHRYIFCMYICLSIGISPRMSISEGHRTTVDVFLRYDILVIKTSFLTGMELVK